MKNNIDQNHIWHPYSSITQPKINIEVESAKGVYLNLANGKKIVDGMSSWWCAIHGYNNKIMNRAIVDQVSKMSHVMFGGITHQPAIELTQKLLGIVHDDFKYIFYSDSGSVSVEVAMKMALQYWSADQSLNKNKFLTIQKGYHGDTFAAMSVCDPSTGMHKIFSDFVPKNFFAPAPQSKFGENLLEEDFNEMESILKNHASQIAAIIMEPIVQGAGGMRMYSKHVLVKIKELSQKYNVLLIFDEIATGFARTGKLFAYEHAGVVPDILCVGKALTGGYLSLAATITTQKVAHGIERDGNIFMHGPTFMANPLACVVASTSIDILLSSSWENNIKRIENLLLENLKRCSSLNNVKDVRVLGAIGVVELHKPVDTDYATKRFLELGVWVRPFLNLVYIMPPYIIKDEEIHKLTDAMFIVVEELGSIV